MIKIRDIAKDAGVSTAAVSYVLNGRAQACHISPATAARIQEAAQRLGYRRNDVARAMITGRSCMIGALVGDLMRPWVGAIMQGAIEEAESLGYIVKILIVRGADNDRQALDRCIQQRVAGAICVDINPSPETFEYYRCETQRCSLPLATINSSPGLGAVRVDSDDALGCRLAVEHLAQLGHRRIAFIGGAEITGTTLTRREGFLLAMQSLGLAVNPLNLENGNWLPADTERATRRLLSQADAPTAIFAANDAMGAVVLRTARKLGLSLPRDLSVVGYSNEEVSLLCDPPLTTLAQPHLDMGRKLMKALLEHIAGTPFPANILLPVELLVRESTARAPNGAKK